MNHCHVHTHTWIHTPHTHSQHTPHTPSLIALILHAHSYCIIHTLALIAIVHPSLSPLHSCAPFNVSLSYKNNDRAKIMTPSCTYRGSPQPQLRWLRNNVPLVENGNSSITVHLSQSSFDSLLTVPLMTGKVKVQYTL